MINNQQNEYKLLDKQKEAIEYMKEGKNIFLTGSGGTGKCMNPNTPIIMFDGHIKLIKYINKNDLVMGDDSTQRIVLDISSGSDEMYRISTENGDSYEVNSKHILTFKTTYDVEWNKWLNMYMLRWGGEYGEIQVIYFKTQEEIDFFINSKKLETIIDIPIEICINLNTYSIWRKYYKAVYKHIDFPEQFINVDPYIYGYWLGQDNKSLITVNKSEINLNNYINTNGKNIFTIQNSYEDSYNTYSIDNNTLKPEPYNKFRIQHKYKINSFENRLKLLAGLIDSCGLLKNNSFEITEDNNNLFINDIYFLSKSLGFKINYRLECDIFMVLIISGNIKIIPTLTFDIEFNTHTTNQTDTTSEIKIESIGIGHYCGFELDGNHRFLLGNFLVTHNSHIIKIYNEMYSNNKKIAITSTTGTSAILINGTTLHSYLGIGIGNGSVDNIVSNIMTKSYLKQKWQKLDVLVIDEISMLSPSLFDKLEQTARVVRSNSFPFGGIQLILTGDFFQLPVVNSDKFCFEAKSWSKCIDHTIYLTTIMRQRDVQFQKCLNNIRIGNVNQECKDLLSSRIGFQLKNDFGIKPTQLFSTNASVDEINDKEMDLLAEKDPDFYEYTMTIHIYNKLKTKDFIIDKIKKNCQTPETIQLCVGAQVMLLINLSLDDKLANGSRGIVTKFFNDLPVIKFLNGVERIIDHHIWEIEENGQSIIRIIQIPLKLAFATTIHKMQGSTLDYAVIDLSNTFEYGQSYVALSRISSIEGLSIINIDFDKIKASPKALDFYKNLN